MLESSIKVLKCIQELECFDNLISRLIELNGGKLVDKEQFDADQQFLGEDLPINLLMIYLCENWC